MYTSFTCNRCGRTVSQKEGNVISFMPTTPKLYEPIRYDYTGYNTYVVCPDCAREIRVTLTNRTNGVRLKYTNEIE